MQLEAIDKTLSKITSIGIGKKQFKTLGKTQPFFRRFEDYTVNIICAGLLGAVLFFVCCIFIVVINAFVWDDWYIDISAKGIKNMQFFWQDHSSLLSSFFYSITLFVACHNLMKYIDVEMSRSLSEIR